MSDIEVIQLRPGSAHRRRLGDYRQPGREPVADDHRPGRAGDVVLAEQGDADSRPALGEPYRRLAPVAPKLPAVPEAAPGALRLTVV
jgi:hypothetical protein